MNPDDRLSRLSPDLLDKLAGRAMSTALAIALGLPMDQAKADHDAHLKEISRRDSLALHEVTYLRSQAEARTDDYAEAWGDGYAEGWATAVLRVLQGRGITVHAGLYDRVTACSDLATLTRWLNLAFTVTNPDDLFTAGEQESAQAM